MERAREKDTEAKGERSQVTFKQRGEKQKQKGWETETETARDSVTAGDIGNFHQYATSKKKCQ